jgi:transcriptional regulator with XRE-family HTH domain
MKTIHTSEYKKLLVWLREARKEKGLTMRVVGHALKIPHSWIGKVEIGERRLDIMEFVKLCRVLGCDPHEGLSLLESQMRAPRKVAVAKKKVLKGKGKK